MKKGISKAEHVPKTAEGASRYAESHNDSETVLEKLDKKQKKKKKKKQKDDYSMDALLMPDIIKAIPNTKEILTLRGLK